MFKQIISTQLPSFHPSINLVLKSTIITKGKQICLSLQALQEQKQKAIHMMSTKHSQQPKPTQSQPRRAPKRTTRGSEGGPASAPSRKHSTVPPTSSSTAPSPKLTPQKPPQPSGAQTHHKTIHSAEFSTKASPKHTSASIPRDTSGTAAAAAAAGIQSSRNDNQQRQMNIDLLQKPYKKTPINSSSSTHTFDLTPPFASMSTHSAHQTPTYQPQQPQQQQQPLSQNMPHLNLNGQNKSNNNTPPQSNSHMFSTSTKPSHVNHNTSSGPNDPRKTSATPNSAPRRPSPPQSSTTQQNPNQFKGQTNNAQYTFQPELSPAFNSFDLFNTNSFPTITQSTPQPKSIAPSAFILDPKQMTQQATRDFQRKMRPMEQQKPAQPKQVALGAFPFGGPMNTVHAKSPQQPLQPRLNPMDPLNMSKKRFSTVLHQNVRRVLKAKQDMVPAPLKKDILTQCKSFLSTFITTTTKNTNTTSITTTKLNKKHKKHSEHTLLTATKRSFIGLLGHAVRNRMSSRLNREKFEEHEAYKLHRPLNDQYWALPQNHANQRFMTKFESANLNISSNPVFYTQTPDDDHVKGFGPTLLKIPMSKMETNLDQIKQNELIQGTYQGWDATLLQQINPDGSLKLDAHNTSHALLMREAEKAEFEKNNLYFNHENDNNNKNKK